MIEKKRKETKDKGEGQGECRSIPDAGPTKHQKEEEKKEMKGGREARKTGDKQNVESQGRRM